ncbi:MAG TPA: efflux RND transporter periplasmic adaptor subunit [Polyangiaceae bacterium]|nr:efflux RND transporter periplasmic adaptor subunit [Polyangiaceae bacterium]
MSGRWLRRSGIALFGLVLVVGIILYWSRSKKGVSAETKPQGRDVPYLDGKWIRYSAEYAKRAQIEMTPAERSNLAPVVSVTGTVTFDPEKVAAVGARIAGRVRQIFKLEGDPVKAGDVLCEIESAELGQAQATLLSARAHAAAATTHEKRERELAEARISSNREAELAAANAVSARADLQAAEQRVRALGGVADGTPGILRLSTPLAGKVIERHVSRGQSVEATHTAFRVADLSSIWVQLAVFERQLTAIQQGDAVDLYPQGAEGEHKVKGSVAYVGDVIDLETRTAPVRVEVDHPEIPLRPGQSVLAKIHTSAPMAAAIVVPRGAVTSVDGKPTIFVAHDALSVEPRAVQLGGQDGDRVEVLSGLEVGDRVVTSGVFALKSEIFR